MPSYRPKSLNELNSMYDKKLAAENALKKGSSQLNDKPPVPDTTPPEYEPYKFEESKFEKKAQAPVDDISGAVNEFIKNFGKQEDKKAVKVQNIHPVQTTVHSTKIASKTPHKPHTRVETPKKKAEPTPAPKKQERTVLVRNDERSDLMDDYKRIMMDEDEDSLSIKERLALKKKSKAEKKENKKEAKQKKEHKKSEKKASEQNQAVAEKAKAEEEIRTLPDESKADADVVIEADDISAIAHSFISSHVKQSEAESSEEEILAAEEDVAEDIPYEEYDEQDTDVQEYEPETEPEQAETEAQDEQSETVDEAESEDEEYFDSSEDEEEEDMFDSFVSHEKPKSTGGAGRVISLLLLFVLLILTAAVGSLKYVASVDTGKAVFGKYYVFTAKESFTSMNINVGDLVVSENRPASATEAFVYYDTTSFRFAKPSDIVSPNSYVVTAENDNGPVLASTDNVRGTVILSVPVAGKIVSLIMSNFLVVFLSLTGLCLVMIIISAILFAKGRKRQQELLFSAEGEDDDVEYYEDGYDYEAEENEAYEPQQEIPEEEPDFEQTQENAEYAYTADSQPEADYHTEYSEEENENPMPFYELADEEEE